MVQILGPGPAGREHERAARFVRGGCVGALDLRAQEIDVEALDFDSHGSDVRSGVDAVLCAAQSAQIQKAIGSKNPRAARYAGNEDAVRPTALAICNAGYRW